MAYGVAGLGRFRVNVLPAARQRRHGLARHPHKIRTTDELKPARRRQSHCQPTTPGRAAFGALSRRHHPWFRVEWRGPYPFAPHLTPTVYSEAQIGVLINLIHPIE